MTASLHSPSPSSARRPWWRRLGTAVLWLLLALLNLWAIGALWFDFPSGALPRVVAILYAIAAIYVAFRGGARWKRMTQLGATFTVVLIWWLSLRPSNDRFWQPDVARTAWAEVSGDVVTLHNVRNCEYRTEMDYTPRWETRVVNLSRLRGIDIAINYWGSAWMAHPVISFQFEDVPPVCFSIETRKEDGEAYSAIGGLYRQFELICVCADERDVIRVRTNFRQGEDVYLYRTKITPEQSRQRFLEYVSTINSLHSEPRWYHAITTNCTTGIRTQHAADQRVPWDWRILLNGYADEMLYEHGALAGDLPFPELKRSALINKAARAAGASPDFSKQIRAGRPGFTHDPKPEEKQAAWIPPKYSRVIGYRFQIPQGEDDEGHFSLIKDGKVDTAKLSRIQRDTAELTRAQTTRLTNTLVSEHFYGFVACYIPHHIFVFYSGDDVPVAAIEVCFECREIRAIPEVPESFIRHHDLARLAALIDELGLWNDRKTAAQWITEHQTHLKEE